MFAVTGGNAGVAFCGEGWLVMSMLLDGQVMRPSHLVAIALVERHGPDEIARRASELGISKSLTEAMITVCVRTAVDIEWCREVPRSEVLGRR